MSAASLHLDLRAAFRQRLLSLILADSGPQALSAAGATYSRATGSFLADGFAVGDEIAVSGFQSPACNGTAVITALSATAMTVDRTLASEGAGAGRRIVAGLPQGREWEGTEFTPQTGRPWLRERFRPIVSRPRALGAGGTIEHTMTGNLSFFYPSRKGTLAVERMAGACLDLLAPGTPLAFGANAGIVQQCERAALVQEPDWISAPVIVSITAYTSR